MRDKFEEVNDVDKTNLELRKVFFQECGGSKRFHSRDITATSHNEVRVIVGVTRTRPFPNTKTLGTVRNSSIHVKVLQVVLLIGNDNVDVILAVETMVHDREKTVTVGREVDTDNLGGLVGDDVEETRVLVSETVVVLTPDGGSKENVKRGDFGTPFDLETLFDPLAVLVNHRVDDMDEGLIRVQLEGEISHKIEKSIKDRTHKTVSTRQDITLKPSFNSVLRQNLHHSTRMNKVTSIGVLGQVVRHPNLLTSLIHSSEFVGLSLIRAKKTEVILVLLDHISKVARHVGHARGKGHTTNDILEGVVLEVGKDQGLADRATIRHRVSRHTGFTGRRKPLKLGDKFAVLSEELFGLIRSHPVFQELEVFRIGCDICKWDLVGSPVAFEVVSRDVSRRSPTLGGSENNHRPTRTESLTRVSSLLLVRLDLKDGLFEGGSHSLVHRGKIGAFDKVGLPAVADKESLKFFVGDSSKDCGVVDLVTKSNVSSILPAKKIMITR